MNPYKTFITCMMLLTLTNHAFCQKEPDAVRHLTINCEDSVVKFSVLDKPLRHDIHLEDSYFWYYNGKIHHNQGGASGKLLHATYEVWNQSNTLFEKGQFNEGLKVGMWIRWYANGKIKSITPYKEGRANGAVKIFNTQGKLIALQNYKKGVLHGKSFCFENDTITHQKFYNGKEVFEHKKEKSKGRSIKQRFPTIKKWFSFKPTTT